MARTHAVKSANSWDIDTWPANVYPGSPSRAKYLLREHRDELVLAGALARIGRRLVVLGDRYAAWLQRHTADVPAFVCNASRGADGAPRTKDL